MIAEGYNPKYFKGGRKNYGQLIKIFANRSEAAEFRRRTSLFDIPEESRASSPSVGIKKRVARKDKEIQTTAPFEQVCQET